MCAKHYWRVQRHGNPHTVLPRGPKPTAPSSPSAAELSRLHHELAGLRAEYAALRQQRTTPRPTSTKAAPELSRENQRLKAALQTAENRILQLNQRIKQLEAECDIRRSLSSGPTLNITPANGTITEDQRRKLLATVHPDRATSAAQKKRFDEAFKIVNGFTVIKSS
jgi:hypothetical protein